MTLSPVRRTPGAPDRPVVAGTVLVLAGLGVAWALFRGDAGLGHEGAAIARLAAAGAAVLAALLVAVGVLRAPRLGGAGAVAAVALGAYGALAAVSMTWSVSAQLSRDDALTALAYLAAYLTGATLIPALGRPFTTVAVGIGGLSTAVCAWAIVARSFDELTGPQLSARLTGTAGLPNMLAMLALFGLLCGVALAVEPDRRQRIAGGSLASLHACTLLLTGSRGGLLLALIGAVTLLILLDQRPLVRFAPLVAALPGAAAGLFASTWQAFEARPPIVPHAGIWLLLLAAAATALGAVVSVRLGERLDRRARRRRGVPLTPRVALLVLALVAAAVVGGVVAAGGPASAFDDLRHRVIEDVGAQEGVRQTSISANQRDHWWRTAWDAFLDEPLEGHGAGTFRLVEQYTRTPSQPAGSPHNTILEALAGTGLAGGVLITVAGVGMLLAAVAGVMSAARGEEAAAAVLALGTGAVLVHGLIDVDWDAVGIGIPVVAVLGALAARGVIEDANASLRALAAGTALAATALIVAIVPPWLAVRDVEASERAEDPRTALDLARSARAHDPRSVDALLAEADARHRLDDREGAERALQRAIELEPTNYLPYLRLGLYRGSWGQHVEADEPLVKAWEYSGQLPSLLPVINDHRRAIGVVPWGE